MNHTVSSRRPDARRGQLVLVAAVVVAVALIPIVVAYLQLGYHADVRAGGDYDDPTGDATRTLTRALATASADVPAAHGWTDRDDAATTVRDRLEPRIEHVERARLDAGTARSLSYNATEAQRWAASSCPSGDGRSFGRCVAIDGVVVQERADRTHVLGVAVDLTVTSERGRTMATVRVPTVAGRES